MSLKLLALTFVCLVLIVPTALRADDDAVTPAPTIDPLPAGWTHDANETPARHKGSNEPLKAYFDVTAEPKSIAFEDWCKKVQKRENKNSPIMDNKDTPLKSGKIGAYNVMMYETTGTLFLNPVHCRFYLVELPNSFARLCCDSGEDSWGKIEAALDDLVKNMK